MTSPFSFLQNEWPAIYDVADKAATQGIRTPPSPDNPVSVVFDHPRILREYFLFKKTGRRPKP